MKSWNAKVLRFDLVQAVSAVKSSRVWRQVHPVYIGLPMLYDEGRQKTLTLIILFYGTIPLCSFDILALL